MSIITVRDDAHWHELRLRHIGGSDVAALFGMSKFSSKWQLWMEKAGKLPPEDLSDNNNVQAGKFLEIGIANWAASKWGIPLTKVQEYHVFDDVVGMGATLDYVTDDGHPVEIKWSARGFGWEYEADTITHAPDNYLLQCQHQLACYGGEYAWLIALIDNEPRRMKVPRNEEIIDAIKSACVEFWFSIAKNTPPDPDFTMDADAITAFIGQAPITDITLDDSHVHMFTAYLDASAAAKDAEAKKEAAKAELLLFSSAIMADRNTSSDKAVVRCGDHKVSITKVADNPGKEVTPDMVGTRVGSRKGYTVVRVS
jgi:putative phage-type endonuclease